MLGKSTKLSPDQVKYFKKLHKENVQKLSEVIDGRHDLNTPKPITHPNASCIIAHCIGNLIAMANIINKAADK